MSWHDKLRKPSFRGVPFHWESSDVEFGQRIARHDYPQRDESYFEPMGKIPREFYLDLYVIGPDYMEGRDRLMSALEEPGPGTLVHPTFGTLTVTVIGRPRLRETTREGGMARFTVLFARSGENKYPSQTVDTAGSVSTQSAATVAAAKTDFVKSFTVANQPAFVQNSVITSIQGVTTKLNSIMATFPTTALASSILSEIRRFESAIASAILAPKGLADSITGMVTDALGMFLPSGRISMALSAYNTSYISTSIKLTTPSRIREAANLQAIDRLVKVTSLAVAAEAATEVEYATFQDAVATRTQVLTALENAITTMPDEIKSQLHPLRTAMIRFYRADSADLSRIVSVEIPATLPALVVAHNLYGDATRAAEIVSRNRLPHPGFVPGGRPLEVLTNA